MQSDDATDLSAHVTAAGLLPQQRSGEDRYQATDRDEIKFILHKYMNIYNHTAKLTTYFLSTVVSTGRYEPESPINMETGSVPLEKIPSE